MYVIMFRSAYSNWNSCRYWPSGVCRFWHVVQDNADRDWFTQEEQNSQLVIDSCSKHHENGPNTPSNSNTKSEEAMARTPSEEPRVPEAANRPPIPEKISPKLGKRAFKTKKTLKKEDSYALQICYRSSTFLCAWRQRSEVSNAVFAALWVSYRAGNLYKDSNLSG